MAGYIISSNSIETLEFCQNQNIYSTILSTPNNIKEFTMYIHEPIISV